MNPTTKTENEDDDEVAPTEGDEAGSAPEPTRGTADYSETLEDPEDIAAREAREAVEREQRGETEGEDGEEAEESEQEGEATDGQYIPYPRFSQVLQQRDEAFQTIEYMRKAMAARQGRQPEGQPGGEQHAQPEPQPDPQQRITDARARIKEAASRYDQGEITLSEFKDVEDQAEDEIWQVRQESLRPPPPTEGPGDRAYLEQQEQQLYDTHPYLQQFSERDLHFLADIAKDTAARDGRPIGSGPAETARLREIVAQLTDTYGPAWYGPPPQDRSNGQGADEQPSGGAPQPRTQRQRETQRALDTADRMPPDISGAGRTAEQRQITDEDILGMTEDEIMELPSATRARIQGIT